MTKFVWHNGMWMQAVRVSRPPVFPGIITDGMAPALHPCDGQTYDSKSQFRRITAQHGMIEMGNDAPMSRPEYEPQDLAGDIAQSIEKLNQGYEPEPLESAGTLDGQAVETRIIP